MTVYMVTMEYAGLAEAGGVKLVARSLSEALVRAHYDVTVVIPRFGCTDMSCVNVRGNSDNKAINIYVANRMYHVELIRGTLEAGVKVVLVSAEPFREKQAVYTYTEEEEAQCPSHKKGMGHLDGRLLDTLLCKSATYIIQEEMSSGERCVVLCEDAATAAVSAYLAMSKRSNIHCIVTIHNAAPAYHHEFASLDEAERYTGLPHHILCGAFNGKYVEPFLLATESATIITVSNQYAAELNYPSSNDMTAGLSSAFHAREVKVTGILNGIDYDRYDPAHKIASLLPYEYDASNGEYAGKLRCRQYMEVISANLTQHLPLPCSTEVDMDTIKSSPYLSGVTRYGYLLSADSSVYSSPPLLCYHGRFARQKGIEVLCATLRLVLDKRSDLRFIAVGQGEVELEAAMEKLASDYNGRIVYYKGYNKALSRLAIASSDYIVLPSITEPCGQEDYIAQIYGTLPIAHATGGLQKITHGKTGFLYSDNTPLSIASVIAHVIDTSQEERYKMAQMAASEVKIRHSWDVVVHSGYIPLFMRLVGG